MNITIRKIVLGMVVVVAAIALVVAAIAVPPTITVLGAVGAFVGSLVAEETIKHGVGRLWKSKKKDEPGDVPDDAPSNQGMPVQPQVNDELSVPGSLFFSHKEETNLSVVQSAIGSFAVPFSSPPPSPRL